MWTRRAKPALLCALALASTAVRAEDTRAPPAAEPDPGFLEFLGSVDRLAEVNPEYLSQAGPPAMKRLVARMPPPPPPPPPQKAPGAKNND